MCEVNPIIFILVMFGISSVSGYLILRYLNGGERPEYSYMPENRGKSRRHSRSRNPSPFPQHLEWGG